MTIDEIEQQRRVAEARARIREGYITPEKVDELVRLVAGKRGQPAADQLRADMRQQYRMRGTWLNTGADPPGG